MSDEKITIKLNIRDEFFLNNGKIILDHLPSFNNLLKQCLSHEIDVKCFTRKEKGKARYLGIEAADLNNKLRELIVTIPGINKETHVEEGVFFHNTKTGFDFSIYDKENNMNRLRNYYMGVHGLYNGEEKIKELFKKLSIEAKDWKQFLESRGVPAYEDVFTEKSELTIMGELQFGNWALVYRDLFRLLNADVNPGIDFYIYITSTRDLEKMLSAKTVCFNKTKKVLEENYNIIKTPIWLIGVDVEI